MKSIARLGRTSTPAFAWGLPLPSHLDGNGGFCDFSRALEDQMMHFDLYPEELYKQSRRFHDRTLDPENYRFYSSVRLGHGLEDLSRVYQDVGGVSEGTVGISLLFIRLPDRMRSSDRELLYNDIQILSNHRQIDECGIYLPQTEMDLKQLPKTPVRVSASLFNPHAFIRAVEQTDSPIYVDAVLEWRSQEKRGPIPVGAHSFRSGTVLKEEEKELKAFDVQLRQLMYLEQVYKSKFIDEVESGLLPSDDLVSWGHRLMHNLNILQNHCKWHFWVQTCVNPAISTVSQLLLEVPNAKANGSGLWLKEYLMQLKRVVAVFSGIVSNRLHFLNTALSREIAMECGPLAGLSIEEQSLAVIKAAGADSVFVDSSVSMEMQRTVLEVAEAIGKKKARDLLVHFSGKRYDWKYEDQIL